MHDRCMTDAWHYFISKSPDSTKLYVGWIEVDLLDYFHQEELEWPVWCLVKSKYMRFHTFVKSVLWNDVVNLRASLPIFLSHKEDTIHFQEFVERCKKSHISYLTKYIRTNKNDFTPKYTKAFCSVLLVINRYPVFLKFR